MKTLCVIPARLSSSRLPQKMLAKIQGVPIIVHTLKRALSCREVNRVIVAIDSIEVSDALKPLGIEMAMTPKYLTTGSDRVAFVAKRFKEYKIIINLQGDEPFIKPTVLSTLISSFKEVKPPVMSTIAFPIINQNEYENPNFVKVVIDQKNNAIFFSRAPIPYLSSNGPIRKIPALHHVGVYAYQRDFLLHYTKLTQTPLEKMESLEQLRVLEHGYDIRVIKSNHRTLEINTPEDLEMAQLYKF